MLAFLQRLKENLALFQRMQLVCEGHLRSFTGNTYVRLRATLAYACEEHLHALVKMTSATACAPTHHAPRTIFNFSSSHRAPFKLFFIIYINIYNKDIYTQS